MRSLQDANILKQKYSEKLPSIYFHYLPSPISIKKRVSTFQKKKEKGGDDISFSLNNSWKLSF